MGKVGGQSLHAVPSSSSYSSSGITNLLQLYGSIPRTRMPACIQVLTYRVPSEVEWLMESLNRDLKHVLLQKALQSYTISAEDAYCTGKTAAHVVHDRQMHGVLVKAEDEAYFTASTEALRHQAKTGGPSLRLPKREQAVQEPRRMKQHKTDWISVCLLH